MAAIGGPPPRAPNLGPPDPGKTKGADPLDFSVGFRALQMVGETGFEPATPWSRRQQAARRRLGTGSPGFVSYGYY